MEKSCQAVVKVLATNISGTKPTCCLLKFTTFLLVANFACTLFLTNHPANHIIAVRWITSYQPIRFSQPTTKGFSSVASLKCNQIGHHGIDLIGQMAKNKESEIEREQSPTKKTSIYDVRPFLIWERNRKLCRLLHSSQIKILRFFSIWNF